MSSFMVYLILILDNIKATAVNTMLASLIFLVITVVAAVVIFTDDDVPEAVRRAIKPIGIIISIVFVISLLLSTFLPNTKQMAAIIIVPKITNAISQNEELKKLPDNILKLANDWIVKLSPEQTTPEQGK